MAVYNTGVKLKNFLETPEKPISLDEYFEFWNSLSAEEQAFFRGVEFFELPG